MKMTSLSKKSRRKSITPSIAGVVQKMTGVVHCSRYVDHNNNVSLNVRVYKGSPMFHYPYFEQGEDISSWVQEAVQFIQGFMGNRKQLFSRLQVMLTALSPEEKARFHELNPDLKLLNKRELSTALQVILPYSAPRIQRLLDKIGKDLDEEEDSSSEDSLRWRFEHDLYNLIKEYDCI